MRNIRDLRQYEKGSALREYQEVSNDNNIDQVSSVFKAH